ncbi:DUF397 domain-containing protein [Amycolatopsis minnesotensis]|uniref:DUF397 domain-containing protein n=1 Tax=Amycolatopsis minnesotensis TaxID=337894 RepID=UPI0031D92728
MNHDPPIRREWRKSTRSGSNPSCVEVSHLSDSVAVRDSKSPYSGNISFTQQAFEAFLRFIKDE